MRTFVTRRLPVDPRGMLEGEVDVWESDAPPSAEVLRERARGADALVSLLSDRIDAMLLDACPSLRIVANYAVGYDNVDVAAATERGVAITNTPDVLTDATADLTMTLLLAVARRLREAEALARTGDFGHWSPTALLGLELRGATLGIVGHGRIGAAVAERARAFGMNIVAVSRSAGDFDAMLATADVVSIHCPLTEETRGLFDARAFAQMRPGAILVNTARGPIVDEAALVDALDGSLGGAGLDVYQDEPRVHPALLERDDVVLTPHIGSATERARRRMAEIALSNVAAVLRGERPLTPVNG